MKVTDGGLRRIIKQKEFISELLLCFNGLLNPIKPAQTDYQAQKKATDIQSLAIKVLRCVGDSNAKRSEGEAGIPLKLNI